MKTIFITSLSILFFISSLQSKLINGRVIDAQSGLPLSQVEVQVKNTQVKTKTDTKGFYEISVSSTNAVLIFSHKQYSTKEVNVGNKTTLNVSVIKLPEPKVELEVVAYEESIMEVGDYSKAAPLSHNSKHKRRVASGTVSGNQPYYDAIIHNTEEYDVIKERGFISSLKEPLSTFSIDVDAASYSNIRRMINNGQNPHKDAVRIEEMINYFDYDYPNPVGEHPFSITTEVSRSPWNEKHQLVHIGLQGKKIDYDNLSPSNLVLLIDVSGSMSDRNKLPLLISSMKLMLEGLQPEDRVAIVVYAGAAGLVLPSTPVSEKQQIITALDRLQAGGSTAGGAGIKLAYDIAQENLMENGNNRVILATDGDFNVGPSSSAEMVRLIEEKRQLGIFLTITGFGMGNYKDGRMEQISNAGNGNYFYIDNIGEARKVFNTELRATLFTIAKDVKLQLEFNPDVVQSYRLIGYENRMLNDEDFNDDKIDAGELGAGHTVTALYEIIPVGVESEFSKTVDPLKYQSSIPLPRNTSEILTVKFRYKRPKEDRSNLIVHTLQNKVSELSKTSDNFRFSAAVAEYGMLLRDSEFKSNAGYDQVLSLATAAKGIDQNGYRWEFIKMVESSKLLAVK